MSTTRIAMNLLAPNQYNADVTVNQALLLLDAMAGGAIYILNNTLTAPPSSPATGDAYIVASGGSGLWAGYDGKLVIYNGGWTLAITIQPGWMFYNAHDSTLKLWNGTAFKTITLT